MTIPTGLRLRPEFLPQHEKGNDPGRAKKPGTPPPSGDAANPTTGTTEDAQKSPAKNGRDPFADMCGGQQVFLILAMIAVFYFVLLRPGQKQEKQLKAMRSELKKGDKIVTTGGMHATVVGVEDSVVSVRPSADGPVMKFDMTAIGRVAGDETAQKDGSARKDKSDDTPKLGGGK